MLSRLLPLILLSASFSFALGITLPLIQVDRLYFLSSSPSLIEVTTSLWSHENFAIAIVTAAFSLLFPLIKLIVLHLAAFRAHETNIEIPKWFKALVRWSLLDVMVVALIIFAAKTSGLATAVTKPGLWFFAISAVLTALASSAIANQNDQ
ncbi:MAG: paraquat-inducible protein A [Rhizobiaceae bacterium]